MKSPSLPPAPTGWRTKDKPVVWTLSLTTITPMFGGGAVVREVGDPPVRAASIRGHLRFWWRATTGAAYTDSQKLYEAESEIWGDTEKRGKIGLRVIMGSSQEAPVRDYLPAKPSANAGPLAGYFIFPFNEDANQPLANGRRNVSFDLTVTMPADLSSHEEVMRAVQAWISFGGIGARTRRGCGALTCTKQREEWLPKSPNDRDYFQRLVVPTVKRQKESCPTLGGGWIRLGSDMHGKTDYERAEECWRNLGLFWSRFRKGHFIKSDSDYKYANGCEWDDHENLGKRSGNMIHLSKPYVGLPIIYHDFSKNDPKFRGKFHGEITSEHTGRMASPVILKPIAFSDGAICPMVACLSASEPKKIRIKGQQMTLRIAVSEPVLRSLNATTPLDAVSEAARRCGFDTEMRL